MRSWMIAFSSIFVLFVATPATVFANILCVTADKANLRSGPGTNFKISWTVGRYMPLKQVGAKGSWLKVVDLDGESHWVISSLVSSRIQCVVVKAKYTALRTKPRGGEQFSAPIPIADRYTPFKKIQREDNWLLVEDNYKQQVWVADAALWWPVNRSNMKF